jgi:hypothetical protein
LATYLNPKKFEESIYAVEPKKYLNYIKKIEKKIIKNASIEYFINGYNF